MGLEFSGKTDIGRQRNINQDSYGIFQRDEAGLFVVADGMGGYKDGEKASQRVVTELSKWWEKYTPAVYENDFTRMMKAIEQVIIYANQCIYNELNGEEICGTTIALLFIFRNMYGIVYAGDSRIYYNHKLNKFQLTTDEVWENQSNLSSRERMDMNHPYRGKLTNAIGVKKEVSCKIVTNCLKDNTKFLLCTDGLYKYCSERKLFSALRKCKDKKTMNQEMDKLIHLVYDNGAGDNITIVTVCYKEN